MKYIARHLKRGSSIISLLARSFYALPLSLARRFATLELTGNGCAKEITYCSVLEAKKNSQLSGSALYNFSILRKGCPHGKLSSPNYMKKVKGAKIATR